MSAIQEVLTQNVEDHQNREFKRRIESLVQPDQYVGDVFGVTYDEMRVQVHDLHRAKSGGIPAGCFLLATRLTPGNSGSHRQEDATLILLRVIDSCELPNSQEAMRIRTEAAQRASGNVTGHWDESQYMDSHTNNFLSFSGLLCKVLGTFYFTSEEEVPETLKLSFGSDLANFYPNQGLKVFKPIGQALQEIVNFSDDAIITDDRLRVYHTVSVPLGRVRYASTDRPDRARAEDARVWLHPANLLAQKTAVFGMSRTGKSNTVKVIAKSVFDLRFGRQPLRVGQVIFDFNGEYANDNPQDPSALFNVWKSSPAGVASDVVRYGLREHPKDPDRKIMKLNFYSPELLQIGKEMIDSALANENSQYFRNFVQVRFEGPVKDGSRPDTRYDRRVLVYRSLLAKAGFTPPNNITPRLKGLFSKKLCEAMTSTGDPELTSAASVLAMDAASSWSQAYTALSGLNRFISEKGFNKIYGAFEEEYIKGSSSNSQWADQDLRNLLGMFSYANGTARMADMVDNHTATIGEDYASEIHQHLNQGKLVIIDQSAGDDIQKDLTSRRVMSRVFHANFALFSKNELPPDILVYAEEAHNLLPSGNDMDLKDVWVRTSKEGSKCNIGLVYITQEPSSIQRNIVKNTANFFLAHINNEDELREVSKYYDFADFTASIRKSADRGFIRFKSLTNSYTVPIMVDKFELPSENGI